MGRSVAKILAQKGANIVIVARNVEKLESALQEIKVIAHLLNAAGPVLTYLQGRSLEFRTTLPLPQRRRHQTERSRPHRQRSNCLEQRPRSRHRLVPRGRLLPHSLP
jgi:NAD(P)-dependent dehydrogenase (short-subunit alcohol dehydrogenase family)